MMRYFKIFFALFILAGSFVSCKKVFDVKQEGALTEANHYRNVYDADAAVIGIYGKLLGLAKQYVVLNELRADLTEVTQNSDEYLRQIATHNVTEDNPYADPRPFYNLIMDCNDALKNFMVMRNDLKMTETEFAHRYSDVGAVRSWLYLQLGIHYGNIPYVTNPVSNINDLKNEANFPLVPFDALLDTLINFTATLPYLDMYPSNTSLQMVVDGYNTQKFFINKRSLLGDLYLWRGNYNAAATQYRMVMDLPQTLYSESQSMFFDMYKVRFADVATNNDLSVGYIRFRENDINAMVDNNGQGWRSMFARGQDDIFNWEWMWFLPFDKNFKPANPLVELFSPNGGKYLLKPSQQAIDYWNSQVQDNNFPFDARNRFSYRTLGGQNVIMKYLYNYLDGTTFQPINVLEKTSKWFLYRAAAMHLHFAEAANREGKNKLAYAFVNKGILATYDMPGRTSSSDVTEYQNTLWEPYPYNFDARNGDFPRYRAPWHRHAGLRGRAYVKAVPIATGADSTTAIENMILDEGALELAFEGYRWPDLLRIAKRRNDPSILADRVAAKLQKDGVGNAADVKAKLMNPSNWYLPFKWK